MNYKFDNNVMFAISKKFNENPSANFIVKTSDNELFLNTNDAIKHIQHNNLTNVNFDILYYHYFPKTLIIYNEIEFLAYVVLVGDYSRFHGVCVNSVNQHEYNQEFCDFFYNKETGDKNFTLSEDKSLIENKKWDKVAVCTFLP